MQIRQVKWSGGGLHGFGLGLDLRLSVLGWGLGLRLFVLGSAGVRRFLVTLVMREAAAASIAAVAAFGASLVWERKLRVLDEAVVSAL